MINEFVCVTKSNSTSTLDTMILREREKVFYCLKQRDLKGLIVEYNVPGTCLVSSRSSIDRAEGGNMVGPQQKGFRNSGA
jgi:hypothetical protein